ncbi:hypothetical protein GIB67_000422 [Kingdonia uniflora]|uniref:FAE domain-containing protein n=1 Tax=Kingdonia uniflora TaxID=39325 RepID=A0A7J7MQ42_9MAGN|nr:hypothetical protein GIB67_000422 [Kingdonia uniflora]
MTTTPPPTSSRRLFASSISEIWDALTSGNSTRDAIIVIHRDLAKDLLGIHPSSYALVVSTEVVSFTWYNGKDKDMLFPNCFFRMDAAAMMLSNQRLDKRYTKYELKQVVRTHKGMDDRSLQCIYKKEESEGKQGLSLSKDLFDVGGHALKANITTLGPLVLFFF